MTPQNRTFPLISRLPACVVCLLTTLALSAQQTRFFRISSSAPTFITACTRTGYVTWSNSSPGLICTVQTASVLAPGSWTDYAQVPASNHTTSQRLFDPNPPVNMVFVPAGLFQMGDSFGDIDNEALPVHTVYTRAFYMDRYEVTKALWDDVYDWATNHGYVFEHGAQGKATNHPAHSMTWYDAVKWCNARSEKEMKTPAYYLSAAQEVVYRSGENDLQNDWINWTTGYRLPTEAEWEKAARGGPEGHRFPWSDTDEITPDRANCHFKLVRTFDDGVPPPTSPVGYFAPNGYGLYDMAGNVIEWCWDWHDVYSSSAQTDPRGPATGTLRVIRGGSFADYGAYAQTSFRWFSLAPNLMGPQSGFRAVFPGF